MIKSNGEILEQLYHLHKNGIPSGSKVGLDSFDELLTFVKGGCTDITGYPFSKVLPVILCSKFDITSVSLPSSGI